MKSLELILIKEADSHPVLKAQCFLTFYIIHNKSLQVHQSNYPQQRERVLLPKAQLYVFCTCRVWLWVCILNRVLTVTIAQPVCNNSFASISILCHLAGDIPLGNQWFILCSDSLTVQFSHLIVLTWMHRNMKKMFICTLSIAKMIILSFSLSVGRTSDKCFVFIWCSIHC